MPTWILIPDSNDLIHTQLDRYPYAKWIPVLFHAHLDPNSNLTGSFAIPSWIFTPNKQNPYISLPTRIVIPAQLDPNP